MTTSKPASFVDGTASSAADVNTAINGAGGLFVNTQSAASAVAAKSIDSIFTSAAWAYRIYMDLSLSAGGVVYFNLRSGGADNVTAASYKTDGAYWTAGAHNNWNYSTTYWELCSGGAENVSIEMMLWRPYETAKTRATWLARNDAGTITWAAGGNHTAASTFDGFTVGVTSGTMTGDIIVHSLRGDK